MSATFQFMVVKTQQVIAIWSLKIGWAAANPRLMCGKPLWYGTMGLVNGNIYLRNIRLIL